MLKDEALVVCKSLFNREPSKSVSLGGNSRDSVRVYFGDHSVIATKREHQGRADLEAIVLRELNLGEGPVPKILHYQDNWLIQEDLGDIRLPIALTKSDPTTGVRLLSNCLAGLKEIHRLGNERHLDQVAPRIGQADGWLDRFIRIPEKIGERFGNPAPVLDFEALLKQLETSNSCFLKWDTRPGNIILSKEGEPKWIDWEHCGVRNSLDDAVWLLCDEYVPDWPDFEEELITFAVAELAENTDLSQSSAYLTTSGTFHMCHRLSLILAKKGDGPWWNVDECLLNDRVGVFPIALQRTCNRAKRWAAKNELTAPLIPWLDIILKKFM